MALCGVSCITPRPYLLAPPRNGAQLLQRVSNS